MTALCRLIGIGAALGGMSNVVLALVFRDVMSAAFVAMAVADFGLAAVNFAIAGDA